MCDGRRSERPACDVALPEEWTQVSTSVDPDDSAVRLRVRSGEQNACVRLTPNEAQLVAGAMLADADEAERFAIRRRIPTGGPAVQELPFHS